jgi:acyl-CoA synthetase (AMP-forming)/AMP-acid ligase II
MISFINRTNPDNPAIVHQDSVITYRQLLDTAGSLANGLRLHGCRPGDKLLVMLDNGPEILYVYYACCLAGIVAIPVMGITRQETITAIIEETKPVILVTESKYSDKVDCFSDRLDIYLTNASAPSTQLLSELMDTDCMLKPLEHSTEQTMLILYTTGSTGMSKGVMHSAKTFLLLIKEWSLYHQFSPADRALICLSLSHIFNLVIAFSILFTGGTIYIEPNDSNAAVLLKSIVENKITVMGAVPSMYCLLIKSVAGKTPVNHHLRLCVVGGDIAPTPLHVDFKAAFGLMLNEHLGSTEFILAAANPMDDAQKRPGSAGKPFTHVQILIDRPDSEGRGEILVNSPYLFQRYYNEKKSRENEWFHTGDAGFMDDEGYLWFQGRMKDLIVHDGYNISPLEIEDVLYEYPSIQEAAVIGVPSELYGEDIVVYISFKQYANNRDRKAVEKFLASRLEYFKHPKKIVCLATLPKNQLGKMDRNVLKEWALAREGC